MASHVYNRTFGADADVVVVVVFVEQGLMRELELREKKVNGVQATGDKLLRDGHPARKTIEVQLFRSLSQNRNIRTQ